MLSDDLDLDDAIALPEAFAHVQDYLHLFDPDLRLRASVERDGWFVLERRCRRAPAVNTGMRTYTDIHVQARDGYIHVSLVHVEWLHHPWNIIIALREEGFDTWASSAEEVADELDYEERFIRETRRRRRRDDGRAYYRELFDVLGRLGNGDGTDVTRWNAPGLPPAAPAEGAAS